MVGIAANHVFMIQMCTFMFKMLLECHGEVFTFQVTQLFESLVSLHGVLQERLETSHGVEVAPCE